MEKPCTVEPRFKEVAGDRPNLFVKWRVRYVENLDITNFNFEGKRPKCSLYRGHSDWFVTQVTSVEIL